MQSEFRSLDLLATTGRSNTWWPRVLDCGGLGPVLRAVQLGDARAGADISDTHPHEGLHEADVTFGFEPQLSVNSTRVTKDYWCGGLLV